LCGGSLFALWNAGWVDVTQFPGQQNAGKKKDGKANPCRQRPGHVFGCAGGVTATPQHEEKSCPEAGKNGHKRNEYKVGHGQDYLVNTRLKFVLITLATVVAVAVTVKLGLWQLSRASEKQARQSAVEAQGAKAAVNSDFLRAAADPLLLLHQHARLRGTWVPAAAVFLENRPMHGRVGLLVIMPFVLEGGTSAVAVQRGWAPRGFEDRTLLPQIVTPSGVVEIEGRLAMPPSDLYALGAPTAGVIRQNLALPQYRAETGLPLLPISLQLTGDSHDGLLRDWPAADLGLEKNYGYAFQWFGLAALVSALYLWFQIVRRFIHRPKD
jgi:surfeit locus 1 family protein